jgi:hypothetical protein
LLSTPARAIAKELTNCEPNPSCMSCMMRLRSGAWHRDSSRFSPLLISTQF